MNLAWFSDSAGRHFEDVPQLNFWSSSEARLARGRLREYHKVFSAADAPGVELHPSTRPQHCLTDEVIESYVMGSLPPAAEATIEEHYLTCPNCADRIQAESDFRSTFIAASSGRAQDRRVVRRRAVVRDVMILRDNGQRLFGKSVDTSNVGVGAFIGASIDVGEVVDVQVGMIRGRAKVVRCEPAEHDFRIGMEFLIPRLA